MMTSNQIMILRECVEENPMGRIGWPLSMWNLGARAMCEPLIDQGLLIERRLGGYPGVQITDAGREAYTLSQTLQAAE